MLLVFSYDTPLVHNLLNKNLFSNDKKSTLEISMNKKPILYLTYSQQLIPIRVQEEDQMGRGSFSWWNVACAMHSDFLLCISLKLPLASSPSQADLPCLPCSWVLLPWGRCGLEILGQRCSVYMHNGWQDQLPEYSSTFWHCHAWRTRWSSE